VQKIFKKNK